jgi:hypothetical protein
MGKGPAVVEEEIREKRALIARQIEDLKARGKGDFRELSDRITRFTHESPVGRAVESRPLLTLAGAVGAGVILGMATGGGRSHEDTRATRESEAGGGILTGLMGLVQGMAVDEGKDLFRDLVAPKKGPANGGAPAHGRSGGREDVRRYPPTQSP